MIISSENGSGFSAIVNIGAVTNYPGYYADNRNLLSELAIRLQDNYYYQRHSYEIESPVGIENYSAQVLDAIHPAGRKLFGRLVVEDLTEYQQSNSIFGFTIGNLYAEAPSLSSSVPYENVGNVLISASPVFALGLTERELNFLAMRLYYPHEFSTTDMNHSNSYYDGEFTYSDDSLTYIGGYSNTPANLIVSNKTELMPDPILYRFSFNKSKAKLWIAGNSKTLQKSESVYLEGALTDSKLYIDHSRVFRTYDNDFSVKFEFRPEIAEDKALVAKSGSGFYSGGVDDEIWGGSGTAWPSTLTGRSWGIGFSASRKVYVNLFDVSDDNPPSNGRKTYTHSSTLDLDQYHCILFSYNNQNSTVSITVNGITETFTHVGDINDSVTPITIGSTYHVNPDGRSHTFKGGIRNLGIWNRVVEDSEYSYLENKNYQAMKTFQRHGLLFFSNLNYPYPVDETGYNNIVKHFYATGDSITQCFDQQDNISYRQNSQYNITEIEDVTFWNGIGLKATNCFSPTVYQSTGSKQENLVFSSLNLLSSHWLNISPQYESDQVVMILDNVQGEFDLIPDLHLVEKGQYTLEFEIQNNIRNEFGNVKGFKILFASQTIAELYKIQNSYIMDNITFSITPDGNWIHCVCNLDLTSADPNSKFRIRMLTTDLTSVYDNFTPIANNDIAIRRFHLYKNGIEDTTYIETKNVPKVSGSKTPSILLGNHQDGFEFVGEKLNIENKAIFCVCTNEATIIDGPDYRLTTSEFISNRGSTPISVSLSSGYEFTKKLIRAIHIDTAIEIYRKVKDVTGESISDIEANDTPLTGTQTYTIFADCQNFKVYELIVLDDPTDKEIEATTNHLIEKYDLQ